MITKNPNLNFCRTGWFGIPGSTPQTFKGLADNTLVEVIVKPYYTKS